MAKLNNVYAYTDGSTHNNPGIGGYAAVIVDDKKDKIIHTYCEFIDITTNNQAELLATIYSVKWFIENYGSDKKLVVISDSKYCTLGFNSRMLNWKDRDWKNVKGKYIANCGLWETLYEISRGYDIFFQWVKGHSGVKYNEIADEMCRSVWKKRLKKIKDEQISIRKEGESKTI